MAYENTKVYFDGGIILRFRTPPDHSKREKKKLKPKKRLN